METPVHQQTFSSDTFESFTFSDMKKSLLKTPTEIVLSSSSSSSSTTKSTPYKAFKMHTAFHDFDADALLKAPLIKTPESLSSFSSNSVPSPVDVHALLALDFIKTPNFTKRFSSESAVVGWIGSLDLSRGLPSDCRSCYSSSE